MTQIPDFNTESFDDPKELRKELTRVLAQLGREISRPIDVNLGDNVVLNWVDDGKTVLPDGYKVADGRNNGTFDTTDSKTKIIFIQKVK